jgi:nitrate reductase beta subunit
VTAPNPGQVLSQAHVCRLRVAGGLVYDSKRMDRADAEELAEQVLEAMAAIHRQPVLRFDSPGYPVLGIATRSITTAEAVPADTPTTGPMARGGNRR